MRKKTKVLLAEANEEVSDIVYRNFQKSQLLELLAVSRSARQLRTFLRSSVELPDVIWIDADLDSAEDFRISRWSMRQLTSARIVLWIDDADGVLKRQLCCRGVTEFVSKRAGMLQLTDFLCGRISRTPRVLVRPTPLEMVDTSSDFHVPVPADRLSSLTHTETHVLRHIVNHRSAKEIRRELSLDGPQLDQTIALIYRKTLSSGPLDLRRYAIRHRCY